MKIVLIKYNAGNIQSVQFALQRIGVTAQISDDKEIITGADRVIFPGVGEAGSAMAYLKERNLDKVIKNLKQPVLGICVGMQLLCRHTDENDTDCIGVVPISLYQFRSGDPKTGEDNQEILKVPQTGWNSIYELSSPLFEGIDEYSYVYNVHSYFAEISPYTIAKCRYGVEYAAAIKKDNFYGVQFHAEKSALVGEQILKNFLNEEM